MVNDRERRDKEKQEGEGADEGGGEDKGEGEDKHATRW
jgi:hypothetical protein